VRLQLAFAMASALQKGASVLAQYSADGEYYRATVVSVSESQKRSKAPVQVRFEGYEGTEWKAVSELKSKLLKTQPKAKAKVKAKAQKKVLSKEDVVALEGYWSAANYLTVGQIYLRGKNPLMKSSLSCEDIKARLLGHWGTCPGLNFVYAHLNRVISRDKLSMCFVAGPGHGGPGVVAHVYLEDEYTKVYPKITVDEEGMSQLFKQFSWPRGIPSHVSPDCPGSFHEGGELGYSLLHSFGAILDNKDLIVACVVGDGEAETGPLATSWHSGKFVNPVTDGQCCRSCISMVGGLGLQPLCRACPGHKWIPCLKDMATKYIGWMATHATLPACIRSLLQLWTNV